MQQKYILRSEGTIVLRKGPWVTATNYAVGNLAKSAGIEYYCWAPHLSGATTEPGVGADWEDVWECWGIGGDSAYVYIAYASDDDGTGFTLVFDPDLDYIAILPSTVEIPSPVVGDFAGLWKNYKGTVGQTGQTGQQGIPGTPLDEIIWRGPYNAGTTYAAGDGVTEGYVSIQDGNVGHATSDTAWWVPVATGGGSGAVGPFRITHDGGASQALTTANAIFDIAKIVTKCIEASATRTVNIGWAADTDALMADAEVPKTINAVKVIRFPTDEQTASKNIIATVGGSGATGEWDVWLEISEFT